ncbi:MAG: hypothetical protein DRH24_06500 [Deltaproteobacteria bacterium]|nr:MAG: hypothetical protein DRH24_06500 [Deltaproteobacteria bacterium]
MRAPSAVGEYIFQNLLKRKYAVVIVDKAKKIYGWEFFDFLSEACNRAAELAKNYEGKRIIVLEAKEVMEHARI